MLDARLIIAFSLGCISVFAALIIALWVPIGRVSDSYDFYEYSSWTGFGGDYNGTSILLERAPEAERNKLREILKELVRKPAEDLYILRNEDDVCASIELIDCRGIPNARIKPFIDKALELQMRYENNSTARETKMISIMSTLIAFLALIISVLKFWRKETAAIPPTPSF
jgi:hypothetical protein